MNRHRAVIVVAVLALVLAGASLLNPGRPGLAQDGTPEAVVDPVNVGHPAHVHAGGCGDDLGEVIEPLSDLTRTEGEPVGMLDAIAVSRSFTTIPVSLDDLLAEDHAINVHRSAEEIDTYLACGEIGGVVDFGGALTIGLRDVGDRGNAGIAYLSPEEDGAATGILVFMTERGVTIGASAPGATPVAAETGDDAPESPSETPTPEPTEIPPTVETVEVSLTEWGINMPTTIEAGPVTFEVINDGTVPHTFLIANELMSASLAAPIGPGETGVLEVELAPGTYTVYCPLGDGAHREIGMELELTVQ